MEDEKIVYVESDSELKDACALLLQQDCVAVDTEFFRETTYYPVAAIIQLYAGVNIYIVDCLTIEDWEPLRLLFISKDCLKLLHSCSEDLEIFRLILECEPDYFIDTQIAAAIAGHGFSVGYQNLVAKLLNVEIDKEQTRSDWLQRPLSAKQIHYAANDVRWLIHVWRHLKVELEQAGRLAWCFQDCDGLLNLPLTADDFNDNAYLRVKAAWRLDAEQLNILKQLCSWREDIAQQKDVPRSRIISDACAIELAIKQPKDEQGLLRLQQLRGAARRAYGQTIIMEINAASAISQELWPSVLVDKSAPLFRRKLKLLKTLIADEARIHSLPPEILGRKKELELFLASPETSLLTQGWRGEILKDKISKIE